MSSGMMVSSLTETPEPPDCYIGIWLLDLPRFVNKLISGWTRRGKSCFKRGCYIAYKIPSGLKYAARLNFVRKVFSSYVTALL